MRPLTVLFAGLGSIGQCHLRALTAVAAPGRIGRILAWRTGNDDRILAETMTVESETGLVEKYQIEVFHDLSSALVERPDVMFVTNPTSLHMKTALAGAIAGCHLFIEKPLGDSNEKFDELCAHVARRNLVVHIGFQLRFHPAFQAMLRCLNARALGDPVSVRAFVGEYLPAFHPWEDYRESYAAKSKLGGGVVLTQSHEIDLLLKLFGVPESVLAVGGTLGDLDIDVEDTVSSLMMLRRYDGKVIPVSLHQDYLSRPARKKIEIFGTAGALYWDRVHEEFRRFDNSGRIAESHDFSGYPRKRLYEDQMRAFLGGVDGRPADLVSLDEAFGSLSLALAIKTSLQTGQPVKLNHV